MFVLMLSIVRKGDAFTINVDTKFAHFSVRMRSPYVGAIDVCIDVVYCGEGRRIHHQC